MGRAVIRLITAMLSAVAHTAAGLRNGLAMRPPMGWRSWEAFYDGVDEVGGPAPAAGLAAGARSRGYGPTAKTLRRPCFLWPARGSRRPSPSLPCM